MSTPIRVLIVEATEDSALLLLDTLQQRGYTIIWKWIETSHKLHSALVAYPWDIILLNCLLPHLDTTTVLAMLREQNLDVPCIAICESAHEQRGLLAMEAGAQDYVVKDNLMRLGACIERELRMVKLRQEYGRLAREHLVGGDWNGSTRVPMNINQWNGYAQHHGQIRQSLQESSRLQQENRRLMGQLQQQREQLWKVTQEWTSALSIENAYLVAEVPRDSVALQKLEQGVDQLHLFTEHARVIMFRYHLTPHLQADYLSPSVKTILGYTPEAFYTDPTLWQKVIHPVSQQLLENFICSPDSYPDPLTLCWVSKDGRQVWLEQRAWITHDATGNPIAAEGLAIDVTRRKQTEDALECSRSLLQGLLDHSPVAILVKDLAGRCKLLNQAMATLCREWLRVAPEQIIGKTAQEVAPPEIATEWNRHDEQVLAVGQALEIEERWVSGNRRSMYLSHKFPLYDAEGTIYAIGIILTDITTHKRTEEALLESQALLQKIIDNAPVLIFVKDLEGRILLANQNLATVLQLTPEQLVGRSDTDFVDLEMGVVSRTSDQQVIATGKPVVSEQTLCTGGELRTYLSIKFPIFSAQGTLNAIGAISADITERKQAEEEIRKLNADLERQTLELQALNVEREAFSFAVAHDLRNPLWVVSGFSETLLTEYADKLDTRGQAYVQRIYKAAAQMTSLIDDLMRLASVTGDALEREPVSLSVLAEEIMVELQQSEPERALEWHVAEGVVVEGDRRLLHIMLANLLDNAWKFTHRQVRPRIEFGVRLCAGQRIYFVQDNGVGFRMEHTHKLFRGFQRLHNKREFPGTGIGLVTVQRIVHRHGGHIWAESIPGEGATFYFTLPTDIHTTSEEIYQ